MRPRDRSDRQAAVVRRLLEEGWPEARGHARALARVLHLTIAAAAPEEGAAAYGKYLFEGLAGVVTARAAPAFVARGRLAPAFGQGGLIGLAPSRGGREVVAAVAEARQAGAVTLAVTGRPGSPLARAAEHAFVLHVTPSASRIATGVALALLAANLAEARGRTALSLAGLAEAVAEAAGRPAEAERLAARLGRRPLVVLGTGFAHASALEAARAIRDLAGLPADAHPSAKRGERGSAVLVFGGRGAAEGDSRAALAAARRRGARVYAITNDERLAEGADDAVLLRAPLSEALLPITFDVVARGVAAALARRRGRGAPSGPRHSR